MDRWVSGGQSINRTTFVWYCWFGAAVVCTNAYIVVSLTGYPWKVMSKDPARTFLSVASVIFRFPKHK